MSRNEAVTPADWPDWYHQPQRPAANQMAVNETISGLYAKAAELGNQLSREGTREVVIENAERIRGVILLLQNVQSECEAMLRAE